MCFAVHCACIMAQDTGYGVMGLWGTGHWTLCVVKSLDIKCDVVGTL